MGMPQLPQSPFMHGRGNFSSFWKPSFLDFRFSLDFRELRDRQMALLARGHSTSWKLT